MKDDYVKKINEILSSIDNLWILNQILRFCKNITK
jgi:hypothetical protein